MRDTARTASTHRTGLVRRERVLDISHAKVLGVSIAGEKLFAIRTDKGI